MSYCKEDGKDKIIFITEEDYKKSSENPLLPSGEEAHGLIKENGEINWDCPCLQGMADGPCGEEFKGAFSCFHYSNTEPKGMDCFDNFKTMQECFLKHPDVYGTLDDNNENTDTSINEEINNNKGINEEINNNKGESSST
ncbi:mitochondrial intermembrane space import and assembly protein 40 isoform X1 [Hydra vulgaris]|uniref:Mitochondrial intermembrane space import and assembly protein 40 n=1 Tax=Hydra vulgaris TaxID=6087 RepID=T2M9P4_HYDVU|nr:mitochondrial intermembrane space import and assembly protein 40 [Hydra vulgaris]